MRKFFIVSIILCLFFPNLVLAESLEIYSENMVLYNLNEDKMIDEKNKDEQISIASMTKIMTAYVAIQHIDNLEEEVVLTSNVFAGLTEVNAAVAGFRIGEKVTYLDLLYGTLLPSGADATNALAIFLAGNQATFVEWMNAEAARLQLKNTHFVNIIGLDQKGQYSSVSDVAIVLKEAYQNETFKKIFTSSSYTTSNQRLTFYSTFQRILNRLKLNANYVKGAKTGFTPNAGRCLATIAYDEKEDITYLLVTAKAPITTSYYHVMDAITIYEYYFENYGYQKLVKKGDTLVTLDTKNSNVKSVSIMATEDILYYLKNDYSLDDVTLIYDGITTISHKNQVGEELGIMTVYYQDEEVTTIPIILDQKVPFSIWTYLQNYIEIVWIGFGLVLISLCIIIRLVYRKKEKIVS